MGRVTPHLNKRTFAGRLPRSLGAGFIMRQGRIAHVEITWRGGGARAYRGGRLQLGSLVRAFGFEGDRFVVSVDVAAWLRGAATLPERRE